LSPIENLWALVKAKLQEEKYQTMDEMKLKLLDIWRSIPPSLCRNLCASFTRKMKLLKKFNGRRLDRELLSYRRKKKTKQKHRWYPLSVEQSDVQRIVYNEQIVRKLIKKHVIKIQKQIVLTRKVKLTMREGDLEEHLEVAVRFLLNEDLWQQRYLNRKFNLY
jgi:hypothetical protein